MLIRRDRSTIFNEPIIGAEGHRHEKERARPEAVQAWTANSNRRHASGENERSFMIDQLCPAVP